MWKGTEGGREEREKETKDARELRATRELRARINSGKLWNRIRNREKLKKMESIFIVASRSE